MHPVSPFHAGQKWSQVQASDLNQIVKVVNALATVVGDDVIRANFTGNSMSLGLSLSALLPKIPKTSDKGWYKIITNSGSGAYACRGQVWDAAAHTLGDVGTSHDDYAVTGHDCKARDWALAGAVVEGWRVRSANADRLILDIAAGATYANPKDVSYAGEHVEAARGAATAWDRANQGANDGYKTSVVLGEAYYDTSLETWYEYRVDETRDSFGALAIVSAEYAVPIDAPEECPADAITTEEALAMMVLG